MALPFAMLTKLQGILPLRTGLIAGSAAAVVGVLVNLPLNSPSDSFFNSAPVMVVSLVAVLGSGLLWHLLGSSRHRLLFFSRAVALAFGLVTAIAVYGESQMERSVSYIMPLAAIVAGLTGVLSVLLLRVKHPPSWKLTLVAILVAVGLGIGLAGYGDQKSGRLELPPRSSSEIISTWHLS